MNHRPRHPECATCVARHQRRGVDICVAGFRGRFNEPSWRVLRSTFTVRRCADAAQLVAQAQIRKEA